MDLVLSLDELVRNIAFHCDNRSNVENARVCKAWLKPALDAAWHEVESPLRIFAVLAPIIKVRGRHGIDTYAWSSTPGSMPPRNWNRLLFYTARIKTLRVEDFFLFTELLSEFSTFCPSYLDVLPNLYSLALEISEISYSYMPVIAFFLRPSVKRLKVHPNCYFIADNPNTVQLAPLETFVSFVLERSPKIVELNFATAWVRYTPQLEAPVLDLISGLKHLRVAHLSVADHSLPLYESLGRLPNLETLLLMQHHPNEYTSDMGPPPSYHLSRLRGIGYFPKLQRCIIPSPPVPNNNIFGGSFPAHRLKSLTVTSPLAAYSAENYKGLLSTIAERCGLITELSLQLQDASGSKTALQMSDIEVLFRSHIAGQLTVLELDHYVPVNLTLEEMKTIAIKLPNIKRLSLTGGDFQVAEGIQDYNGIPLFSIVHFAMYCHNLEYLALPLRLELDEHIAASTKESLPAYTSCLEIKSSFVPHDYSLPEDDARRIALFLSKVCLLAKFTGPNGQLPSQWASVTAMASSFHWLAQQ